MILRSPDPYTDAKGRARLTTAWAAHWMYYNLGMAGDLNYIVSFGGDQWFTPKYPNGAIWE